MSVSVSVSVSVSIYLSIFCMYMTLLFPSYTKERKTSQRVNECRFVNSNSDIRSSIGKGINGCFNR